MKKFITMIGVALLAASVFAANRYTNTVTIAAGSTNAVATFDIFEPGGSCGEIDTVIATVASGNGTGTVAFAAYDLGVATTIATSGALTSGSGYRANPMALTTTAYTYPTMIVTGEAAIATGYVQTNYAAVAKSYISRQVRVNISQGTKGVANATVYKTVVITR